MSDEKPTTAADASSNDAATASSTPISAATPLELEPWTLDMLGGVATKLGFGEHIVKYASGSNVGDNFMGIMLKINIEGQRNGAFDSQSLMLKMPPQSAARRKQFNSPHLFERETLVYRDILPMFVRFQEDKGLVADGPHGFFKFPKCHAIVCDVEQDRYAIVMEDLKQQGYRMFDKMESIDMVHVRLVVEEIGKFHGVSLALRDQRPELFEPFTQLNDVFLDHVLKGNMEMMQGFMDLAFTRAVATLDESETKLREKVHKLRVEFFDQMESCMRQDVSDHTVVINHGDCWNNNMMYLYKEGVSSKGSDCNAKC